MIKQYTNVIKFHMKTEVNLVLNKQALQITERIAASLINLKYRENE